MRATCAMQPTAMQFNFFSLVRILLGLFCTVIVIAEFVMLFIEFLKYFTIQCNLSTKNIYLCALLLLLFGFCFDLAIDIWFTDFMHLHFIYIYIYNTLFPFSLVCSNIFLCVCVVVLCDLNSFSLHSINT